jgi:hypothetical protein
VGVEDGAEIEHDQWRVEVEAGRCRPVEHAAQVSGAELVERERQWPDADGDLLYLHGEGVGHVRGRMQKHVDDCGEGRLAVRSALEDVERFLAGALFLRRQRPLQGGRCDRVEQAQLPLRSAARGERVEPDLPAR